MKESHVGMLAVAILAASVIIASSNKRKPIEPSLVYVTNTIHTIEYRTNATFVPGYYPTPHTFTNIWIVPSNIDFTNTLRDIAPELDEQFWNSLTQEQKMITW